MRQSSAPSAMIGRILGYTTEGHERVALAGTAPSPVSGVVIRDRDPLGAVMRARSSGYRSVVVPEVGAWTSEVATRQSPTLLEAPDALVQVSLDSWAASLLNAGANAVLTPSKFIELGDWPTLRAVLCAGEGTELPEVITLVATDAAMLDLGHLPTFIENIATHRPVAVAFASKSPPFERAGRMAALRYLLSKRPGCFLLATEPVVATDAYAHGAAGAAIGITGGTRKPHRPGDRGGGGNSKGFLPGLFLRDLWEHRSPEVYADWFANSPSPTCMACGGGALEVFDNTNHDKDVVLRHNVHAWLEVLDELRVRTRADQQLWLADERSSALAAHLTLRPATGAIDADRVLRQLVELDDPQGRRTTPRGALR